MGKNRIGAIFLATLLAVAMLGCSASETQMETQEALQKETGGFPGTSEQDMVTLNITSEPLELNPMRMQDTTAQSILFHCMSGFTKLNAEDQPEADLAEKWDINEEKTVYTMYLRKDATWSNGDPVTAGDFYYSWVMQMTPSTGTIYADYLYKNIKNGQAFYKGEADESQLGLKIIDDYTLQIEWEHPMTNGLFFLAQPFFLPMNQKAYEEIGEEQYAKEADKMVTNGAYQITEWVHNDHILMEKAKDYYGAEKIKIPKVKLLMIGDVNTGLNAFVTGELDLCSLYSEQIKIIEQTDKNAIYSYVDGASWYLNFNTKDPYLSNINLRKALAFSVDVQSLLDYVINDGSVAADGLVPNNIAGADGTKYAEQRGSLFGYDKDAANEYLQKALHELGIKASELKLTLWGTDTSYNKNQAAYLQQQWKENLGLEIALKSVPVKTLSEAKMNGDYSFAVDGWGPSENDPITFLEVFQSENPNNSGKYSNAEYDALISDSIQESDSRKRQEILIQAEKILMDDMAIAPMYFSCTTYGVSDKLIGLVRTPFQFFNVCNAYIKE